MNNDQAKNKGRAESKVPGQKLTAKEEEFIKYHRVLRGELDNANWHFQAWKCLWKLIEEHVDEFNVAHTFFRLTMRAHLRETLARLHRLCENRIDTINMFVFLDFIKKDLDIFSLKRDRAGKHSEKEYEVEVEIRAEKALDITPAMVEEHIKAIQQLPIDRLTAWKDEALDHIDKKVAKSHIRLLEDSPVEIGEVDRIIDTIHAILNIYSEAYDGQTWEKDLKFEHGVQNLMEAVRVGRQHKEK